MAAREAVEGMEHEGPGLADAAGTDVDGTDAADTDAAGIEAAGTDAAGSDAGGRAAPEAAAGQSAATGEPRVDAALKLLERLPGLPVADHAELFEQVHAQLSEVLGELDSGSSGPAGG
jgi:hypothetical protein